MGAMLFKIEHHLPLGFIAKCEQPREEHFGILDSRSSSITLPQKLIATVQQREAAEKLAPLQLPCAADVVPSPPNQVSLKVD